MPDCPDCGQALEHASAKFCQACGQAVVVVAEVDGPASSRGDDADGYREASLGDDRAFTADLDRTASSSIRPTVVVQPPSPVRLEINDNHFYMRGLAGVLELRLTNTSDAPITVIRIAAEGRSFTFEPAPDEHVPLAPGEQEHRLIELEPLRSGEAPIDLKVHCAVKQAPTAMTHRLTLRVLREDDQTSGLRIHVDQSIRVGDGSKVGYGMSVRDRGATELARLLERVRSTNDLINEQLPDNWRALSLKADPFETGRLVRTWRPRIRPIEPPATAQTVDRLSVCAHEGADAARVLLFTGAALHLGRGQRNSDIVLRMTPRSPEHDEQSLRITGSRPHLSIELTSTGLRVIDHHSTGGTRLDGQLVRNASMVPLNRASVVEVAETLSLRLTPLTSSEAETASMDGRVAALGQRDVLWRLAGKLGLRGVRIDRLNNLAEQERYVLVFRDVTVGRAGDADISAPGAARGAGFVRVIRWGRGLWIEGAGASADDAIRLGDCRLQAGELAPCHHETALIADGFAGWIAAAVQLGLTPNALAH